MRHSLQAALDTLLQLRSRAPLLQQAARRASLLYSLYTGPVGQLCKEAREARAMLAQDLHACSPDGDAASRRVGCLLVALAAGVMLALGVAFTAGQPRPRL